MIEPLRKSSAKPAADPAIMKGNVLVYRVFDIAQEIDLGKVESSLNHAHGGARLSIARNARNALIIRNPPVSLNLGEARVRVLDQAFQASIAAKVWDYGVVSIVFQFAIPQATRLSALLPLGAALSGDLPGTAEIDALARAKAADVAGLLRPAIKGPTFWSSFEDYVIYFLERIEDPSQPGELLPSAIIPELLLGEASERLAGKARAGILESTFQYAENDLVTIDWNSALVIEPSGQNDIADVIEFALTHLLEFRYFDDLLDRKLASLYDSLDERGGIFLRAHGRYAQLLREANTRFLEVSEFIERIDNSLKAVGDFYLAVIFRAAVRRFRLLDWQQSTTRKLNLLSRVSEILQAEIDVQRGHMMELVIIVLIAFEILSAIVRKL